MRFKDTVINLTKTILFFICFSLWALFFTIFCNVGPLYLAVEAHWALGFLWPMGMMMGMISAKIIFGGKFGDWLQEGLYNIWA